jgi:hypothetical protein
MECCSSSVRSVDSRETRISRRTAMLSRALTAARRLCSGMKLEQKGVYRIQPELVVALCVAVDDAWECVKGVEE